MKLIFLLFDAFIAVLVIGFIKACQSCLGKSVLGLCSARRGADVQDGHMLQHCCVQELHELGMKF